MPQLWSCLLPIIGYEYATAQVSKTTFLFSIALALWAYFSDIQSLVKRLMRALCRSALGDTLLYVLSLAGVIVMCMCYTISNWRPFGMPILLYIRT